MPRDKKCLLIAYCAAIRSTMCLLSRACAVCVLRGLCLCGRTRSIDAICVRSGIWISLCPLKSVPLLGA